MASKSLVPIEISEFINLHNLPKFDAYCTGCAPDLAKKYRDKLFGKLNDIVRIIPILTTNTPYKWEYKSLNMVSAQTVSGTGILSEMSSSWNDLVGGNSNTLSAKIRDGEQSCRDQLRYNAALIGGNAVIGTDIDYAEVGGNRGMIMVCMAGTAIKLKNIEESIGNALEFTELEGLIEEIKISQKAKINSFITYHS